MLRPLRMLLTLVGLLIVVQVVAGTRLVEVDAKGVGPGETEALADALAKAVAQVNGTRSSMSVSTGQLVVEGRAETYKNGKLKTETESVSARQTPDIRLSSSGSVASYEVTSTVQRPDGKYEVTVHAKVKQYVAPTYTPPGSSSGNEPASQGEISDGKRSASTGTPPSSSSGAHRPTTAQWRVAVVEPASDQPGYDFFGEISAANLTSDLWTGLESALLDTGRVSILDRKTLGDSLNELQLVSSRLTDENEKAKLKKIRGADVLALITIHDARHAVHHSTIQFTGQTQTSVSTYADVEVRAVVPATSEILMSRHYTVGRAGSRAEAIAEITGEAATDIARVLSGGKRSLSEPSRQTRLKAADEEGEAPAWSAPPETPRNGAGVKLPFDR